MSAEKKRWKWQRARIIHVVGFSDERFVGFSLWIDVTSRMTEFFPILGTNKVQDHEVFLTNVLVEENRPIVVPCCNLEFLARSEDDFRDEVELISFADWLKQDDNAQQPAKAGEEE